MVKENQMSSLSILNEHLNDFTLAETISERNEIESDIWNEFGKTGVVCIIDMCGFTKASQERGIIYYLALVRRMQNIVEPIVIKNGGNVVKFEADNCFARFNCTDDSLNAIGCILESVKRENLRTPNDLDITLSIGMDFGKYLLLKQNDYWGDTVNRASKLGEDIAGSGVVLLTDSAWDKVSNKDAYSVEMHTTEISKVKISTFKIVSFG
jgi:adenylate cyclase